MRAKNEGQVKIHNFGLYFLQYSKLPNFSREEKPTSNCIFTQLQNVISKCKSKYLLPVLDYRTFIWPVQYAHTLCQFQGNTL